MRRRAAALALAGALVLGAVLGVAPPARAETLRVGVTSKVLDYLPLLLGHDKGFFKAEGIDVEILVMGTSTRIFPALVGGSIDVFDSTLFVVFLGVQKGEKVEIIGAHTKHAAFHLVTRPEIKELRDMRGKSVGSTGVGSGQYFSLIAYMEKNGFKFPGDYSFVTIGGTPEIWRSMEAGAVDSGVLLFPFHILAQKKGFHTLAALYKDVQYPLTGLAVRSEWARQHEDLLVRYLKGLLRATDFIYTHPEETQAIAVKLLSLQPDMARIGYEEYSKIGQWPRDMVLSDESTKTMLDLLAKHGELKSPGTVDKYVNPKYVRAANAGRPAR